MPHSIKAAVAAAVKQKYTPEKGQCRFFDAGEGLGRGGSCAFGIHHFRGAPSGLGEEGHEDDDDAQTSQPVGHGAEEKNERRQGRKVIDDGGPGAGEAGHAFHQSVQRGESAGTDIGNGIEQGHGNPGKGGDGGALPGREAHIGR